ncbi:MAG: regulatory protein RecX [Alphaproteobacteria bacterium]
MQNDTMNFKTSTDKVAKKPAKKKRAAQKISADYLHNTGLYYLQRFSASRRHFESVMMRKVDKSLREHPDQDAQPCAALVRQLADTFERSGLLDDLAYTRAMVKSLRARGKSKRFITDKLRHRGLKEDMVTANITDHDQSVYEGEGDFFSALIFARKKKIGPFSQTENADPQKIMAQMAQAGFSYDILQKILKMPQAEAEKLLNQAALR